MGLRSEIGGQWNTGGMLVRLILINAGVFLFLRLFDLMFWLMSMEAPDVLQWLWSSGHMPTLLRKPWTVITYMFTHWDIRHIFWNMLILFFVGRIFEDLLGPARLLGNYILGGLMGYALFALSYNLLPQFQPYVNAPILGASAGVMGVVIGLAAYRPNLELHLLLLGPVRMKWIAAFILFMDLISIRETGNSGGHIAHLGGALYGYLAARQLALGNDWSQGFVGALQKLLKPFRPKERRARMRVEKSFVRSTVNKDAQFNTAKRDQQARVDAILDKISRSGYDSLSKEEKDFLFKASGRS
jgi:membrane associated rhomboid family serine protease